MQNVAEIRPEFHVVFGREMMTAEHWVIDVIVTIAVSQL